MHLIELDGDFGNVGADGFNPFFHDIAQVQAGDNDTGQAKNNQDQDHTP
jgi:hypothetical protein